MVLGILRGEPMGLWGELGAADRGDEIGVDLGLDLGVLLPELKGEVGDRETGDFRAARAAALARGETMLV